MTEPDPVVTAIADGVATITINRPEKRNALNAAVLDGLVHAFGQVRDDSAARVVILTGAGDQAFCAGADLGGMRADASKFERHLSRGAIVELLEIMRRLGKPVIARVNGHALAGGFGLVCGTDLAIAADDATFGVPEVKSGLWPFIISTAVRARMPERVALELMMTGRRMDAEEALRWGVVNRVVPRADLDAATLDLATQIASMSPLTLRMGKDSFYESETMEPRAAGAYLHAMLGIIVETEDVAEGVTAFFEKRAPVWKGR